MSCGRAEEAVFIAMKSNSSNSSGHVRRAASSTTEGRLIGLGPLRRGSGQSMRVVTESSLGAANNVSGYGSSVGPEEIEGVYIISVAARILEMHPQTLRKYERAGLVTPSRTIGMLRLYSEEDIACLKLIKHLVGDLGLNLAGVQLVLEAFNHLLKVRARVNVVDTGEVRRFMVESLEETFELLHAHVRQTLS